MTRDQRNQRLDFDESEVYLGALEKIERLAAQLQAEPFDQIIAVTLQELAGMFERSDGVEVFEGTKSSFERALSLVTEILVDKTLYEKVRKNADFNRERLDRLHYCALEITGALCERWAEELISALDALRAECLKDRLP